ncbi:MAG: PhzF family phenazine biosynthesis protein [Loktanella sp.]|nr:PhzF family phenazine biosynthesis protein [Loktanella sp.]
MQLQMYQVDAFTDRVFAGNPAAVLVLDEWLTDDLLLAITQENNLSETAFVKPRGDGSWDLRWFAPAHEVDFCGHATLATAHILFTTQAVPAPLTFHTRVGLLHATQVAGGYQLDLPRLNPQALDHLPDALLAMFDTPPVAIFCNFENIFVDLGDAAKVHDFQPDLPAIATLDTGGLVVTGQGAPGDKAAIVSRYFAPGAGIPEDPVTGSIHATLVPYWAQKLGSDKLLAYQASARGGWLDCTLTDDRVLIVGQAVTYMQASIVLPTT